MVMERPDGVAPSSHPLGGGSSAGRAACPAAAAAFPTAQLV